MKMLSKGSPPLLFRTPHKAICQRESKWTVFSSSRPFGYGAKGFHLAKLTLCLPAFFNHLVASSLSTLSHARSLFKSTLTKLNEVTRTVLGDSKQTVVLYWKKGRFKRVFKSRKPSKKRAMMKCRQMLWWTAIYNNSSCESSARLSNAGSASSVWTV